MSKKFICFVHIEKAGGITMHLILHRNRKGYISPHPDPKFGLQLGPEAVQKWQQLYPVKISGIGGHRVFAPKFSKEKNVFTFTFVRRPYARYLSHLNWRISRMQQDWDLTSFSQDEHFHDYQCLRICGERNAEKAIEVLKKQFDFVGRLEAFDKSLQLLQGLLGETSFDINYKKENVSTEQEKRYRWKSLTEAEKEMVKGANQEDYKLYEFVEKELFPTFEKKINLSGQQQILPQAPAWVSYKRKFSNSYLSKIVQPLLRNGE